MKQRALVTGGSAGLGKALCKALIEQGFEVTSIDRNAPEANAHITFLPCDLADRQSVDALLNRLGEKPPFDIVIFNAGISATGKFEEISPQAHMRVIRINAEAPMVLTAGLMASGKIAQGGHIAFVSSLSHFTGYPGAASYAASKDALAIYANSIRKIFYKRHRIKVTTAFPGPLKTDHAARHAPEGTSADKRMEANAAAALILADIFKGKPKALPGTSARLFAILGKIAPKPMTLAMRKIIYEKLDKTVAD
ncbi:MAG: SDR family NAD(P)-dependent oxidoreductase [Ahrensia sp.]|nr:SDR family NAD(P)-dependent oxidoreductase [Ahrensia sp.]